MLGIVFLQFSCILKTAPRPTFVSAHAQFDGTPGTPQVPGTPERPVAGDSLKSGSNRKFKRQSSSPAALAQAPPHSPSQPGRAEEEEEDSLDAVFAQMRAMDVACELGEGNARVPPPVTAILGQEHPQQQQQQYPRPPTVPPSSGSLAGPEKKASRKSSRRKKGSRDEAGGGEPAGAGAGAARSLGDALTAAAAFPAPAAMESTAPAISAASAAVDGATTLTDDDAYDEDYSGGYVDGASGIGGIVPSWAGTAGGDARSAPGMDGVDVPLFPSANHQNVDVGDSYVQSISSSLIPRSLLRMSRVLDQESSHGATLANTQSNTPRETKRGGPGQGKGSTPVKAKGNTPFEALRPANSCQGINVSDPYVQSVRAQLPPSLSLSSVLSLEGLNLTSTSPLISPGESHNHNNNVHGSSSSYQNLDGLASMESRRSKSDARKARASGPAVKVFDASAATEKTLEPIESVPAADEAHLDPLEALVRRLRAQAVATPEATSFLPPAASYDEAAPPQDFRSVVLG